MRSTRAIWALSGAAALAAACAAKPETRTAAKALGQPQACVASLERPADQELSSAVVETGEGAVKARGLVEAQAFTALQQRLCRGWRCDELAEGIRVVDTKELEGQTCAQAGVSASFLAGWLKPAQQELAAGLAQDARWVVDQVNNSGAPDSALPAVAIAPLVDRGVAGGERAIWLREQLIAALGAAGAEVIPMPADWSGRAAPAGAHGLVRGFIRPGRANKERFEVVWVVDVVTGRAESRAREVVRALAADVPDGAERPELLLGDPFKIGAHVVAGQGGGLCTGQESALRVDLAQPMAVRVFALYGEASAAQVYPRTSGDKAELAAGVHDLLKFTAGELGAGPLRFVVVGAANAEALGRMKTLNAACALPEDSARKLNAGGGVAPTAQATTTSASFRLLGAALCEGAPERAKTGLEWVDDLPTCWEK
jgi:hypothetical protein